MATISKSVTVVDGGTYTLELNAIPTGSTATPVNNIQTWLHCADIWNKSYTTITQVLNDASTLQALIASNNAADYMARSTSWASSVTTNANAMAYIGANNYCANKLLSNSTWLDDICTSTYMESVLNVKVPTMTSNTTPYGECGTDKTIYSSFYPWRAFKGTVSTDSSTVHSFLAYDTPPVPGRLWYHFTHKVAVKLIEFVNYDNYKPMEFKIQGSDDGNTWEDIYSGSIPNSNNWASWTAIINTNNKAFSYWALQWTNNGGTSSIAAEKLQFYGRAA